MYQTLSILGALHGDESYPTVALRRVSSSAVVHPALSPTKDGRGSRDAFPLGGFQTRRGRSLQ
jgi:hypothetical protein